MYIAHPWGTIALYLLQANSFCTTVGSKALTVGQVVIIAACCEFGGAVLLGASVTATIKSGVVRLSSFTNSPGAMTSLTSFSSCVPTWAGSYEYLNVIYFSYERECQAPRPFTLGLYYREPELYCRNSLFSNWPSVISIWEFLEVHETLFKFFVVFGSVDHVRLPVRPHRCSILG